MGSRLGFASGRLSAFRFEQIPNMPPDTMATPHDVTIDIPLNETPSHGQTASRKWSPPHEQEFNNNHDDHAAANEKGGFITRPGRRRRRLDSDFVGKDGKSDESAEGTKLNRVGRFYMAVLNFSIVTRYLIYVTPLGAVIAIPIIVGATAAKDAKIGGVHIYWFFTWIEVIWLSLWTCKIFAKLLPHIFQTLCGFVSAGTRKYALILQALETPITLLLWAVVSLVTFLPIMTLNADKQASGDTHATGWEMSVKNILFALLILTIIYVAEKALVQLISISYHRKQFDARIKESKHNVYLVGVLFDASRKMFPTYCPEFRDEDELIFDSLLASNKGGKLGNTTPLKMMRQVGQGVGRIGGKVTAVFGNAASELTGKQVFQPNATHSIVTEALEHKRCAEALARRIWMSFVVEGRESLYLEDIVEVLGAGHEAEAEECFSALDKDSNGDISLDEMILTITEFGRVRKSLNHSMHDVDQAISAMDSLLMGVATIIGVLVFISFVTRGFGTVIAAGATTLISLSFIFSVTAQEVLGSCVFLFVKHPFDVGDRVDVNDKPYVVESISLLFSVFRNVDDHRMTQIANNILNSLSVDNFTRANAMYEQLKIPVSFDTTFADIQMLREEMERFVRDKDNCRDFQQDVDVEVVGVGDMDKLELQVDIRHKSNWSNETVRATRRSKFMCALVLAIRKIPIRAPGAAAEEKKDEKKDEGDDKGDGKSDSESTVGDNKPTEPGTGAAKPASSQNETVGQGPPAPAATAAAGGLLTYDATSQPTAQSTGVDNGQSQGSVLRRGSSNGSQSQREAAIAERLNARSPAADIARDDDRGQDLFRTTTNSSSLGRQPGAQGTEPSREPSTGRRKEGLRVSSSSNTERDPSGPVPAPLTTVQGGMTPSSTNVPILSTPAPPSSRGSARYEPPTHPQTQDRPPTLPNIISPEHDYQGPYSTYYPHQSTYDPVPVESGAGTNNDMADRDQHGQYYTPSHYDPVSPPSLHPQSPWSQQFPAAPPRTASASGGRKPSFFSKALKRSSRQDEDE